MSQAKKIYVVTDRAGPRVAGRAVKAGSEIELSEKEARFELREGTIVEKGNELPAAYGKDSDQLAALRRRAAGDDRPAAPTASVVARPVADASTPAAPSGRRSRPVKADDASKGEG